MRHFVLIAVAVAAAGPAHAENAWQRSLKRLDPYTRLIQVCDQRGLITFTKDKALGSPDRVVIDAMSNPQVKGDTLTGNGGAMRVDGQWISFAFKCTVDPSHTQATSFRYDMGRQIPKEEWEKFGLY